MNFLGMGPLEMVVVLVVAFLVLGPGKSIDLARSAGKAFRDLRAMDRCPVLQGAVFVLLENLVYPVIIAALVENFLVEVQVVGKRGQQDKTPQNPGNTIMPVPQKKQQNQNANPHQG